MTRERGGPVRLNGTLAAAERLVLGHGTVLATLTEQGDRLPAVVVLATPAAHGSQVAVRPVGVFWTYSGQGGQGGVLGVAARDPRLAGVTDLSDVPGELLAEIARLIGECPVPEQGGDTGVRGWGNRSSARGRAHGGRRPFSPVGRNARMAATETADDLWARGTPARALFKPALGGWIVQTYRRRSS